MKDTDRSEIRQFIKMTKMPVSKLIVTLSVPTVISMLITAVYNIADTFFVSKLGTSASAAVGIVFSVMAIIQAAGFTLGSGAGSLISRVLGKRDKNAAFTYASSAFFAAVIFGSAVAVFGILFVDKLMIFLGSTPSILPYSRSYAKYIFCGAPVMGASFVMNNILRAEGKAAFSMIGLAAGGIINIFLDPIFIFVLGLGTAGAAAATVLSQCISFTILLQFFLRKKSIVRISFRFISGRFLNYIDIIRNGFPSLCRQGLATAATVMLNINAAVFGDAAVAAMTIVTKIIMFIASIMIGIGQGFMPVSGYNYGAKKYDRVRKAYWFVIKMGAGVLSLFAFFMLMFAPDVIAFFLDDPDVVKIGTTALRWQACVIPLHAFIIGTNMLMQSTGQAAKAAFLSSNRQGSFFIPLIILLPRFFSLKGVEVAQACSDTLSFLVAVPFVIFFMKKLKRGTD